MKGIPEATPVWAEIDLAAIGHNISELRRLIGPRVRMLAPVKANAYGHGLAQVADKAIACGVEMLGVARYTEGIELRRAGIDAPILIFGYTSPGAAADLLEYELTPTLFSLETAQAFSASALRAGKVLKAHLKIDTGMGRVGIVHTNLGVRDSSGNDDNRDIEEIERMAALSGLRIEGIYTHFACADSIDKASAAQQFQRFMDILDRLSGKGIDFPIRHAANSAALIDMPETHLDMVRPGIALYGLAPSGEVDLSRLELKPAMSIKARIGHVKTVPAGFTVSYGSTWRAPHATVIATVPIGYADGFSRALSGRGHMLVAGRRAPIVGRVCMDLTMLDVGHIPEAEPETEVVILGRQGPESIAADEIAGLLGTINYEIVSAMLSRVPRFFT